MKKVLQILLVMMIMVGIVIPNNQLQTINASDDPVYENVFNKQDLDNWMKALTYDGKQLSNATNYANMFTTHKIEVSKGDTLTWGMFGKDQYVMELYGAQDQFIKRVFSTEIEVEEATTTVIGVANKEYTEAKAYYEVNDASVSYARILGNISTIDNFMVFKNLENGLSNWPTEYIPFQKEVDEQNPLSQKSALFVGDSIVNAVKDPQHPYYGWAGRIGTQNDMDWKNAGISSATVSTALPSSEPDNRIVNQLKKNTTKAYDYVILQGGMNDSIAETELGEMSDSYQLEDFDISTFSGAMEELIYTAITEYEDAYIGYIVNYATPNSTWGGKSADNAEYFRRAKEICEKWNVPYIDLFEGGIEENGVYRSYSFDILQMNTGVNLYQSLKSEIHIGSKGYDVISPYIAEWMKTLYAYDYQQSELFYYNFENTTEDQLGNAAGQLHGDAVFTNSRKGQGMALETKQGAYMSLPENMKVGKQDFSFAFFVKAMAKENDTVLFGNKSGDSGKDNGFSIMNYDGLFGNVGMNGTRYDTSSYDRDKQALDGTWRHVVVSADRDGDLSLYVDGKLSNANADFMDIANDTLDTNASFVLGAGTTGSYAQHAIYDELKMYRKALSSEEVQNLYDTYAEDPQEELKEALSQIPESNMIRTLYGADDSMLDTTMQAYFKELLSGYADIEIETKQKENQIYTLSLKKRGVVVQKDIQIEFRKKDTLTVATYNMYGWGYPNMAEINQKLHMIDADIVGLQEANHRPSGGGQDELLVAQGTYPYHAFKAGYGTDTIWGGSTIVSKYPLTDIGGKNYAVNDQTNRSYVRSVVEIDGKQVALYNTHIVWLTDPEEYAEYKKAQIDELIEAVKQDDTPYKILMGDYNTDQSKEELDSLLLHFNGANGWKNTWHETAEMDSSMKIGSIDHVFTTTNIEIVDVAVGEGAPSDHDILYTELKLLDDEQTPLPTQLLENTLDDAQVYLDQAGLYEEAGITQLKKLISEIESTEMNEENRYEFVLQLRDVMKQLVKKVEPPKDPILYYDFEHDDAKDRMDTYPGTIVDQGTFEDGIRGNAFVSGNGYVEIADNLKLSNQDFTISFWFQSKEEKQDTVLFANKSGDRGAEQGLFLCNYDGLYANVGDGTNRYDTSSYDRDKTAMDGKWHFITVRGDRDQALSLFVDGVHSSSNVDFKTFTESIDTDQNYVIGAGSTGNYQQKASFDEFKIHDVALSDQQIAYVYSLYQNDDSMEKTILKTTLDKTEALMATSAFEQLAPLVQDLLQKRYEKALLVYQDTQATATDVMEAWSQLAQALHYADFKADKEMLRALIDVCRDIDLNGYTQGVEAFTEALTAAIEVRDDAYALQERIDATYQTLLTAKNNLKKDPVQEVDKQLLREMVELVKSVVEKEALYLQDERWNIMITALEEAEAMLANEAITQSEINAMVLTLSDAYTNIRLLPDEALLQQLTSFMNIVKSMNRTQYSSEHLAFIDRVYEEVTQFALRQEINQEEETYITTQMMEALNIIEHEKQVELAKEAPQQPQSKENSNLHKTNYVKTGDSSNYMGLCMNVMMAGAFVFVMKKRKNKMKK